LKLGFSVGAIWWVMSKISFKEVLSVFSQANVYYLVAAFILLVISFIFSAFRQNLSFRNTGAHISQSLNIKLFWLGMFYNLFLPGGIGGDGYKVYLVNKYRKNGLKKIYLFYLVVLKYFFKSFLNIHAGLFWWSLALQGMQFISAIMILAAFHQTTGVFNFLFLFFISAIATALPITIGGIGAREMVFLIGAKTLGLDNELCIALSIMFFLLSAIISLGGLYWVFLPPFRREAVPDSSSEQNIEPGEITH